MGEDIECEEVRSGDLEKIIKRINEENNGTRDVFLKDFSDGKYPEGTILHARINEMPPYVGISLIIPETPYISFVNKGGRFWRSREKSCDFLQLMFLTVAEVIDDFLKEDGGASTATKVGMGVGTGGYYI